MKSKPVSHKLENTFKFESFNNLLSKINVSVLHNIKREVSGEESITFFAITLEKWFDLNCSQDFDRLRQSIGSLISVQSLPQIIHRKNELIEILVENLKRRDNLAMNVVLELIVSLARDLNTDFYQYFKTIFICLTDLFKTTDIEVIENTFVCLTFLFKYLHKYIAKEFAINFKLFETPLKSKKDYIRRFTCESISFLVRKAQNKSSIVDIVFESVAEDRKLVEGVGQLLFESVKGLNNNFNTCGQTLIPLLFDKYLVKRNDNLDQTINEMFGHLIAFISQQNSELIWKTLLIDPKSQSTALKKVIPLLMSAIAFKKCGFVINHSNLVQNLIQFLQNDCLEEVDKNNVLDSLSHLLINCFQYISIDDIKHINTIVFSDCLTIEQIFKFTSNIFNCLSFERIILPSFLTFCSKLLRTNCFESNEFSMTMKFMSHLILTKRLRPIYGSEVKRISKYMLKLDEDICQTLLDLINTTNDLKMIWSTFVCLPNFIPITNETKVCQTIAKCVVELETRFGSNYSDNHWLGYVMVEAVMALIILKNEKPIHELNPKFFVDLILANPSNTEVLQSLDLFLSYSKEIKENVFDLNILEEIYNKSLEVNLSSFCKTRRLLTLHVLTLFDPPLPPSEDIDSIKSSIFDNCFNAESIPSELREYRSKLKLIQSLDYTYVKPSIPLTTSGGLNFDQMPIHYLFGVLYENLSLLWQPIQRLIEGYAKRCENKRLFFNILLTHLRETTHKICENNSIDFDYYRKDVINYLNCRQLSFNYHQSHTIRPDFANHRLLIIKTIDYFPEVIESSNREFISIFFDFLNNEMSLQMIFGQNSKEDIGIKEQTNGSLMECDSNEDKPIVGRKMLWKTLFSFLSVLSKFKNPKVLYREKELLEFYLNLLSSADSEVQKNAMNCISSYNTSYLAKYRQNFLRLIDEKSFKSEIYSFILNSDDNVLKSEHRQDVVPLIMRILYGKMMSTKGTKRHGKNVADFRRSIILKVLSAFNENELILFLDFIFAPILEFVQNDYKTLDQLIKSKININEFICLSHLQSMIRTLNFVSKHFGNNCQSITSYILKVVVVVSALVTHLLVTQNRILINEHSITRLKDIRCHCFKVAKSFFETYDSYGYSSDEIDSLFRSLIWPMLPNFDTECLTTPTPLLTLLIALSQNSRYFKMFAKSHPLDKDLTPITAIIKIYDNPKAQTPVISAVTEIINNLLILDNFSESEDKNISEIDVKETNIALNNVNEDISLGTVLLLPFATQVLNRIRVNFETNKKLNKNNKKKNSICAFSAQELNILSHLSSYITESDQCLELSLLMIKSIDPKKSEEQKEFQTVKTLSHLVKNIKDFKPIFKSLVPLFELIQNCISRTELCNTLQTLVGTDTQLSSLSQLISNMNAYNIKFPEEPDYPKRIDSFKAINSKIESISSNDFNPEFIAIILYNCLHFVQFCDDLAIRELSSNTIKTLLKKLEQMDSNDLFNAFAIKVVLNSTISKGFRNKNESIRHELIKLLLTLIEISGHRHPILQQLSLFCNKEDEEIDFWLNMTHIQLHRRGRALTRLTRNQELLKTLSNRIFSEFLIPLTTNFVIDIHYNKQPSLVSASIEAIGVFSKYIQWNKYYNNLKFYINQLIAQKGDQKINIKIISSILDNFSFSFDLKANESIDSEEKMETEVNGEEVVNEVKSIEMNENELKSNDKVYDSAVNRLLPLLQKCLYQKSQIDFAYDSMKSEFPEDEEIQRVPIALAIIKLLKTMNSSEEVLNANISSVFLRLCQFLQSRAQSIRDSARNTFIKVMDCLGPKYLMSALNSMNATLNKGFQKHVFVYTVHAILSELRPKLKSGDLDNCLNSLLNICSLELFGNLSEEKEVSKITTKLKEAKKHKSFDIFQIISSFISEKYLTQLLIPLRNTLLEANNHKVVRKVSQSLSRIGKGLIANSALNEKIVLLFIYGLINDMIPDLKLKLEDNKCQKEVKKSVKRIDSFLISRPIYQRAPKVSKAGEMSNSHVMIEFGLNCFLALIKQNRMSSSNAQHLSLIDPFVVLLEKLLESNDPKITTVSLQCLHSLYTKFNVLPTFKTSSENIMKTLFVLLHKYAKFGINDRDDDNVQMVLLCFKTLSLFIKDRNDVIINDEQMAVLLSYIDQDLHNDSRQSTVFLILKSILSRKYDSMDLHRIMKKISEMTITSEIDFIRTNCIQLCVKYLTEYLTNGFKKRINFFLRHLEYEKTTGRESAIGVVRQVISGLSYEFLQQNIALFFIPLSSRLVNESSFVCKKSIADSVIKLLNRITETDRNKLFNDMVLPWLRSETVLQRLLASHLCSLFLTVENKDFIKRLPHILKFLKQQLDPTRYIESSNCSKSTDSLVYQHLNLFVKVMKVDPQFIKKSRFIEDVNVIFEYILSYHILHPHLWIRVISTQIFGQLFTQYSPECLATAITSPTESYEFLISETEEKLSQMVSKFCLLFRDIYDEEVLSDQLIKNLVYISRVFIHCSEDNNNSFKRIINKMIFEVKYEVKNNSNLTKKRILVFKWMAAVAVELTSDRLEQYMANFLPLLCREESNSDKMSNNEENELQILTKQVIQLFKNIIGTEKFSEYYTKSRTDLTLKRLERKKMIAIQSVNEVIKSTKRKYKKHNKNKDLKKRKISDFKRI